MKILLVGIIHFLVGEEIILLAGIIQLYLAVDIIMMQATVLHLLSVAD